MCGRYNLITDAQALINAFDLMNCIPWEPHYNIAPSQNIPAVRQGEKGREGVLFRWGLIPHWAKDEKFGYRTFNARAETVEALIIRNNGILTDYWLFNPKMINKSV